MSLFTLVAAGVVYGWRLAVLLLLLQWATLLILTNGEND